MKRLTTPAKTSMMPTASTMATTMTHRSRAMPTAVITESREKIMSKRAIWVMTPQKETPRWPG